MERWSMFELLIAILTLACARPAHGLEDNWPEFWRESADVEAREILDAAFVQFNESLDSDPPLYRRAIIPLQHLLTQAMAGNVTTTEQQLRTARGWLFLGDLHDSLKDNQASLAARLQGIRLLEGVGELATTELARALSYAAQDHAELQQFEPADVMYRRSLALCDQHTGNRRWQGLGADVALLWADAYEDRQRYAEATPLLERGIQTYDQLYGPLHVFTGPWLLKLGDVYRLQYRYSDSVATYQRSVGYFEAVHWRGHRYVATALFGLAETYEVANDFAAALDARQRGLAIYERIFGPEHPRTLSAIYNLANVHVKLRQYKEALLLLHQNSSVAQRVLPSGDFRIGLSVGSLGAVYEEMGRYRVAVPLLQQSLRILDNSFEVESRYIATVAHKLALTHYRLNQLDLALPLYLRSIALLEREGQPNDRDLADARNDLALLYRETGRLAEALPLLQQSRATYGTIYPLTHDRVTTASNNLAAVLTGLGKYQDAQATLQGIVDLWERNRLPDDVGLARTLSNLSTTQAYLEQYAAALPHARRAYDIYAANAAYQANEFAAACHNLAHIEANLGRTEEALALYARSRALWEGTVGSDHPNVAQSLVNEGVLLIGARRFVDATAVLLRAERSAAITDAPEVSWVTFGQLSSVARAQQQWGLASYWGKQAVDTLQQLRGRNRALERDDQRSFLLSRGFSPYRHLADLMLDQGRLLEAQQVLTLLKEEEQATYLEDEANADPRAMPVAYTRFERNWLERQEQHREDLRTAWTRYSQAAVPANARSEYEQAQARYDRFVTEMSENLAATPHTEDASFEAADLARLQELQMQLAVLGNGAVAIQYLVTPERVRILLTTSTGLIQRDSALSVSELNTSIAEYVRVLRGQTADPFELAQQLHAALVGPIERDLQQAGARVLMVQLDEQLRYLPLAALHDGTQWMAERYAVTSYTPMTRSNLRSLPQPGWRVAGFGVTHAAGHKPLYHVRAELDRTIRESRFDRGSVAGEIYMDDAASKDRLRNIVQEHAYSVIHLASHFVFNAAGKPADSYLVLGRGDSLTLEEFKSEAFRFTGLDLLTLSACETAADASVRGGREIESFGTLAQLQGAQAVLASLWQVNDASTARFMHTFYDMREAGHLTKAEALQAAQLQLLRGTARGWKSAAMRGLKRREVLDTVTPKVYRFDPARPYSHPHFWAPFILMGNWL